jgi:hypothetical protein
MEAAGAPRLDVERLSAGPPLNAGCWSAWATAAGQVRGIVLRPCRCGGRGTKRAPVKGRGLRANCALGTLAY